MYEAKCTWRVVALHMKLPVQVSAKDDLSRLVSQDPMLLVHSVDFLVNCGLTVGLICRHHLLIAHAGGPLR